MLSFIVAYIVIYLVMRDVRTVIASIKTVYIILLLLVVFSRNIFFYC